MRQRLLDFIVCPLCGKDLSSRAHKEYGGNIEEGELVCPSGHIFPITNSIPRMLVGPLSEVKKKTAESFGFEWEAFSDMRSEWKQNFDFYFEPAEKVAFPEMVALEVGCGNGRHTRYAAQRFKELISVDLGGAVDVAFKNNNNATNLHFIQADLDHLPFKQNRFDFIFCIGVLHHLPNPEGGFKKLVGLVKSGGNLLIYVYHSFPVTHINFYLLHIVNFFRRITTKLPHPVLYALCYPLAAASYLFLVLPYKVFFKHVVKQGWPLGAYVNYSFFVMLNDTFDRFSAPIENRYSKEQITAWYARAQLQEVQVLGGSGWRVFGKK